MAKEQVTVPDIGGGEAEVIEILAQPGDSVAVEQGLIVLESDKASMEIPSTLTGVVVEMLVSEGQQLAEGAPIALIEVESGGDEPGPESPPTGGQQQGDRQEPEEEEAQQATAPEGDGGQKEPAAEPVESAARRTVPVPDIGTEEAVDLVEVCVSVGDKVGEGDSLVVLESDKASMEVPAPFPGEVVEIAVTEGDSVRQGDALLVLSTQRASGEDSAPAAAPATEKPKSPSKQVEPAAVETPESAPSAPAPAASGEVYAGPAVRKLAREFGIDLVEVKGTGPRGRILKDDLHNFTRERLKTPAAGPAAGAGVPAVPEVDFAAFGEVEVSPRSKLDKLTAANMHRSWLNVPHVTQLDDADITELEEFRRSMKGEAERRGTRLTPLPFMLKACAVALRDNPKFLTSLADGGQSLVQKHYIHIGMAVDTPAGLLVPVIRDVDKKGVWELAEEVLELADKARDRKLTAGQMQGGCFTISSLGAIGGNGFTPIINTPEVGILGVSRSQVRPVWDGQSFAPRTMLPLSLSYDHRVINGADAGRFLTRLGALLQDIRGIIL